MCAVEIEKMPKLQTACSTAATDGMVVKTKSERVIKNQKSVMEFLLINHPLDCPICDKSGECDLQDFSFKYGDAYSRYTEERRTYMDLDMGPVIKKNMNRCIHCTRCIRFGDEVAGIHEMVAVQRGNNTEITTIDGRPLETDYAGNYADICPTGSLTLKDFRFRKRAWYLKKTADRLRRLLQGLQHGDPPGRQRRSIAAFRARTWRSTSTGSATKAASTSTMSTTRTASPSRPCAAAARRPTGPRRSTRRRPRSRARRSRCSSAPTSRRKRRSFFRNSLPKQFPGRDAVPLRNAGHQVRRGRRAADKILKRKSKTSNLNGLEKLGYQRLRRLPAGTEAVARVPRRPRGCFRISRASTVVGIGVFTQAQAAKFAAVLPGAAFAEKDGTIVNLRESRAKTQEGRQSAGPEQGSSPRF